MLMLIFPMLTSIVVCSLANGLFNNCTEKSVSCSRKKKSTGLGINLLIYLDIEIFIITNVGEQKQGEK